MGEGDGETGGETTDPDREQERYEDLEAIAEDRRAEAFTSTVRTEDLQATSTAVAALAEKDLVARADEITSTAELGTGEDFEDDTPTDDYASLKATAADLARNFGQVGRQQARERFLAAELGFVATDHLGTTSDAVLSLVSQALENRLPADLDDDARNMLQEMAKAWWNGESSLFERFAARYAQADPEGPDLGEHVVFMSIAANLRATDTERSWIWSDRSEIVGHVEEMIEGMTPGEPVDLGLLYGRADALLRDGKMFTPQVGEIVRLALGALAGDRVPVRNPPDSKTATALVNVAGQLEADNASLARLAATKGQKRDPRASIVRDAEGHLEEAWAYLYERRRSELDGKPDGKKRYAALAAAVGPDLPRSLADFSLARRNGPAADVADKAIALREALSKTEAGLRSILGDLKNLNKMTELAVEADVLQLLVVFRSQASAMAADAALGRLPEGDRFAAPIAVALAQASRTTDPDAALPKPARVPGAFEGELDGLQPGLRRNAAVIAFQDALEKWADAAEGRRLADDTRPDPTEKDKTVVWPGLEGATRALVDLVGPAQAAAAAGRPADRARYNEALVDALGRVASTLRADAWVKDAKLAGANLGELADLVNDLIKPEVVDADLAKLWQTTKAGLLAQLPKGAPDFSQGFADALGAWESALNADPRNDDDLAAKTWSVLDILAQYRQEVQEVVTDAGVAQDFRDLFDRIGLSLVELLRGVH